MRSEGTLRQLVQVHGGVDGYPAGIIRGAGGEPGDDGGVQPQVAQGQALVGVHEGVVGPAVLKFYSQPS